MIKYNPQCLSILILLPVLLENKFYFCFMDSEILLPSGYDSLDELVVDLMGFWEENKHIANEFHIYDLQSKATLERYRNTLDPEITNYIDSNTTDLICTELSNYLCKQPDSNLPTSLESWVQKILKLELPSVCNFKQDFNIDLTSCKGTDKLFTKTGMGSKKYHEVRRISELISILGPKYDFQFIIPSNGHDQLSK